MEWINEIITGMQGKSPLYDNILIMQLLIITSIAFVIYSIVIFIVHLISYGAHGQLYKGKYQLNIFNMRVNSGRRGEDLVFGSLLWISVGIMSILVAIALGKVTLIIVGIYVIILMIVKSSQLYHKKILAEERQIKEPCEIERAKYRYLKNLKGNKKEVCDTW